MREKEEKKGVRKSASFFSFFFRGDDDGRRRNDGRRRMLKGLSLFPLDPAISSLEPPLLFVSPRGSREHVAFYLERGDRKHKRRMKAQNAPFWPEANLTLLLLLLLLLLFFLLAPKKKKKKKKKKKTRKQTHPSPATQARPQQALVGQPVVQEGSPRPPARVVGVGDGGGHGVFRVGPGFFVFLSFATRFPPFFSPSAFKKARASRAGRRRRRKGGSQRKKALPLPSEWRGRRGESRWLKRERGGGGRESDGGALVFRERGF